MKTKTSAHYQREYRQRMRDLGLVKKEVWIRPDNAKHLANFEKLLRKDFDDILVKNEGQEMSGKENWTTTDLFEALAVEPLFDGMQASLEIIEGVTPAIHIVMHEFGDLPLFLTVAGEQILVEAILWEVDEVTNIAGFNDAVLRTHKYFPLSTISLDTLPNGKDYYQMFGSLSASSILPNIIFEIEVLASNVIQATEAYGNFLRQPTAIKEEG